jgi:hemin uptake protein HemP
MLSPHPSAMTTPDADAGHASPSPPGAPPLIELDSLQLLRGQREVQIRHGNETYRLRCTRNDRLILTK